MKPQGKQSPNHQRAQAPPAASPCQPKPSGPRGTACSACGYANAVRLTVDNNDGKVYCFRCFQQHGWHSPDAARGLGRSQANSRGGRGESRGFSGRGSGPHFSSNKNAVPDHVPSLSRAAFQGGRTAERVQGAAQAETHRRSRPAPYTLPVGFLQSNSFPFDLVDQILAFVSAGDESGAPSTREREGPGRSRGRGGWSVRQGRGSIPIFVNEEKDRNVAKTMAVAQCCQRWWKRFQKSESLWTMLWKEHCRFIAEREQQMQGTFIPDGAEEKKTDVPVSRCPIVPVRLCTVDPIFCEMNFATDTSVNERLFDRVAAALMRLDSESGNPDFRGVGMFREPTEDVKRNRLETLHLQGLPFLSDMCIVLVNRCTTLRSVTLKDLPSLGDSAVVELTHSPFLETLHIENCPRISFVGITACSRCPALQELTLILQECGRFGNTRFPGVSMFPGELRKLTTSLALEWIGVWLLQCSSLEELVLLRQSSVGILRRFVQRMKVGPIFAEVNEEDEAEDAAAATGGRGRGGFVRGGRGGRGSFSSRGGRGGSNRLADRSYEVNRPRLTTLKQFSATLMEESEMTDDALAAIKHIASVATGKAKVEELGDLPTAEDVSGDGDGSTTPLDSRAVSEYSTNEGRDGYVLMPSGSWVPSRTF
jgi:hypothetical protein